MSKLTLLGSALVAIPLALVASPAFASTHTSWNHSPQTSHNWQSKDQKSEPCPDSKPKETKPEDEPCDHIVKPKPEDCDKNVKPAPKPCEKPPVKKPCDKPAPKPCKPTTPGKGGGTPTPPTTPPVTTTPAAPAPQPTQPTLPQTGGELPIELVVAMTGAIGAGLAHRKLQAKN